MEVTRNAFRSVEEVDLSEFYNGSEEEKLRVCRKVFEALRSVGFVQLTNHNISEEFIDEVFAESKQLFQLPINAKMKLGLSSTEANRGYIAQGQEKRMFRKDRKETFEIGNEEEEEEFSNMWPEEEEMSNFRSVMLKYYDAIDALYLDVMRCIAVGLSLPKEYFTPLCDQKHGNLRLLHYPEFELKEENHNRIAAHCDISALSLLAQDGIGGLEVKDRRSGRWMHVSPKKGAIVVNVGDMLMRWTNDVLTSVEHRVGVNPDFKGYIVPERFSTAFFANANKNVMIDALPGTYGPKNPKKYSPVNAMDYLTERLGTVISTKTEFMSNTEVSKM